MIPEKKYSNGYKELNDMIINFKKLFKESTIQVISDDIKKVNKLERTKLLIKLVIWPMK